MWVFRTRFIIDSSFGSFSNLSFGLSSYHHLVMGGGRRDMVEMRLRGKAEACMLLCVQICTHRGSLSAHFLRTSMPGGTIADNSDRAYTD